MDNGSLLLAPSFFFFGTLVLCGLVIIPFLISFLINQAVGGAIELRRSRRRLRLRVPDKEVPSVDLEKNDLS